MKRFRTRFGLRAMLAIVGLGALVSWGLRVFRESQPDRLYSAWLRDGDADRRFYAAQELADVDRDHAGGVAPALVHATLGDPSAAVRKRSASSLADVALKSGDAPTIRAATAAFIEALGDADPSVRAAAAEALGRIGPGPDAAIPALLRAAADQDQWARGAAITSLGLVQLRAGVDRPEVRGPIVAAIRDGNTHVREMGIYAFWATAEKSPGISRALLGHPEVGHRRAAVTALGRHGGLASAVISELGEALSDGDPAVREGAARALRNAGVTAMVPMPGGPP